MTFAQLEVIMAKPIEAIDLVKVKLELETLEAEHAGLRVRTRTARTRPCYPVVEGWVGCHR